VNPGYGGGDEQPGCYYDFYAGDVHFIMLDGRFYRTLKPEDGNPTMLGAVQRAWLLDKITESRGRLIVMCSPVPWVYAAKGDSKDTWNGFHAERKVIFDHLAQQQKNGVVLVSADRHRSDLWKIERESGYPLYEFNSSRLTNQHVHKTMEQAEFSYNAKQSFGVVDIDTTQDDPLITYRIMSIDDEQVHEFELRRSQISYP
jgi:alkaline phosphatase D